jgi:hypothetical protein
MAIDTSGLLTGLLTPSQRSQQRMNNNANMAQTGLMSQVLNLANTFTDATSNLVGADTRSPEQIAGQQVAELLQAGDIDGAINILKDVDPAAAMTLIARQKAEQERLDDVAKAEEDEQRRLGAQTIFLSNAFPEQASLLTPLLEAGVPLASLVEMGRGEKPVPINQAELTRMFTQPPYNLPAEEAARRAAQAWNARDEQPTEAEEPPRIVSPSSADLDLAEQTLSGVPGATLNAVIDNIIPGDAGVNELTESDLQAELALVIRNYTGRATPQELVNQMLNYYSQPDAVENGFQNLILQGNSIQQPTVTPTLDAGLGAVNTVRASN